MIDRIAVALDIEPLLLVYGEDLTQPRQVKITYSSNSQTVGETSISDAAMNCFIQLFEDYNKLNAEGKDKVNEYANDLTLIEKYSSPDKTTNTLEVTEANDE